MPIGYSGAPRVTQNNQASRLRRLSRSLTTGNNGTPLRNTLFSNEKFQYEASPNEANTNSRRPVLDIFSAEFKDSDGAVVNSCVTAGFWNDCGFIELRCAADNTLVWGINNTFGGGPCGVLYMSSTGYMKADNTALCYDEDLEQLKIYQDTANITPMLIVENDGTGDASIGFRLTGVAGATMGLDNGSGDEFRIQASNTIQGFGINMNTQTNHVAFGTVTDINKHIRQLPPLNTDTSYFMFMPRIDVTTNSTNNLVGHFISSNTTGAYAIGSGVVDSGSREAMRLEVYADNADFQGTLARQRGLFLRTGIDRGSGTVTNCIALDFEVLRANGVITTSWGIYQRDSQSANYLASDLGVGVEPISALESNTSFAAGITEVNVNTTLNATHHTVLVNCNGANRVITLPSASGCTRRIYNVKKIDSGAFNVTVDGNGAETIDGTANTVIGTQYDSVTLQCDGTEWWII